MRSTQLGMTLVEVLVAVLLVSLGVLSVAPMFVYAKRGVANGADFGAVGALAVEQLERLRATPYLGLVPGGSLTSNQTGYFNAPDNEYLVRWQIANNGALAGTKIITLRAMAVVNRPGPRREITLTTLRGN